MAKTVSLTLPLTRADLADLEVGDEVLLSGPVYTMRDAGHERALQCLKDTGRLPFDLEGATLFYAGPTPAAAGRPLGSVDPTTASRMDFATPALFKAGIVAAIGKGKRSPEVVKSCQETGSVYLCTVAASPRPRSPSPVRVYRPGRPGTEAPGREFRAARFPHLRRRRHHRRRPLPRDSRRPISTAKSTMQEALGGASPQPAEHFIPFRTRSKK